MIELLENTQAYRLLQKESEENMCSHAYLLLFDDARNLRIALKEFAKLLINAPTSTEKKRIDKLIDEESYADCLFYPADGKKLAVEDAEKIREESLLSPIEGERKVFVLGDFAGANTQTQNKLLKLLEEPPKHVLFLLGATSAFPVLTTVLSRTKKLEIPAFDTEQVTNCLQRLYQNEYDTETLRFCAAASGGTVGGAQNLLEGGQYKSLTEQALMTLTSGQTKQEFHVTVKHTYTTDTPVSVSTNRRQ